MRSGGLYCCALTTETRHVVQRRAVYNPSEIAMPRTSSTKVKILRLRLKDKHATAQRAGKKHRVRAIHAKIAHRRRDSLRQFSTRLVREKRAIFVGNVNATARGSTSDIQMITNDYQEKTDS
jgi:hypothetical protein